VDEGKLVDLVKAAQGDLSDLDIPTNLREIYCQTTGLPIPGALENPGPVIATTETALLSLSQSRIALNTAIADGQTTTARLRTHIDDLAKTNGEAAVRAARAALTNLDKAISDATNAYTKATSVQVATAASYIAILRDPNQTRQANIETTFKLADERERIRALDTEAANAASKSTAAVAAAEAAAVKAVQ
jgi:hypothetical protein